MEPAIPERAMMERTKIKKAEELFEDGGVVAGFSTGGMGVGGTTGAWAVAASAVIGFGMSSKGCGSGSKANGSSEVSTFLFI